MCLHRKKKKHRKILNLVFEQALNYSRISAFRRGVLKSNSAKSDGWAYISIKLHNVISQKDIFFTFTYRQTLIPHPQSTCFSFGKLPNFTRVAHTSCKIIICVLIFRTWDNKRHDDNIIQSSVLCLSTEWKSSGKFTACAKIETAKDVISSTTLYFSNWTKLCPLKPHIRENKASKFLMFGIRFYYPYQTTVLTHLQTQVLWNEYVVKHNYVN